MRFGRRRAACLPAHQLGESLHPPPGVVPKVGDEDTRAEVVKPAALRSPVEDAGALGQHRLRRREGSQAFRLEPGRSGRHRPQPCLVLESCTDPRQHRRPEGCRFALGGTHHRPGLYYCNECQGQFTVTVGTVFERSKIPLTKWWTAVYLLNSSKKGFSAHQLHRQLHVTYKTAWFMMHRIREAMRDGSLSPMGGGGKTVEVDETLSGFQAGANWKTKRGQGGQFRNVVLTLVERGGKAPLRSGNVERELDDEIEITPQMIEAGFQVLCSSGIADEYLGADKLLVAEIFQAMARLAPKEVAYRWRLPQ